LFGESNYGRAAVVKRAADQELTAALYNYAVYLEKGKAVAQNCAQAAKYFKKTRCEPFAAAKEGIERCLR
jgi:TPR repeat protein